MTCQRGGTWFRLALPVLAAALAGFALLRAQEPAAKKPIPDASSLQQALALVEEVYGGEFKRAKDVAQKTALAERLLQKAKESAADPTGQFVLLRVAKDIAALAGDADLALRAVDDMAATFEIGTLPAKVETLLKAAQAAGQTKQYPVIVEHAAALIELAVQQDDFDTARALSQTAMAAARKSGDSALVKTAVRRGKEIDEMASAYAEVKDSISKLKLAPDDPAANLAVGKYRCLVKGDWGMGISYLALGNDPALKELAIKELKGVSDTDGQVALGDGWWDLAAASEGPSQKQLQARAVYWYGKALPGLSGLVKDKVDKRIHEVVAVFEPKPGSVTNPIGAATVPGKAGPSRVPPPAEGGWLSIFDGRSLKGWEADQNSRMWSVIEGTIVGDNKLGSMSHLYYKAQTFANFEAKADVKINSTGNSGLYLRATPGQYATRTWIAPFGYEVQILGTEPSSYLGRTGSIQVIDAVKREIAAVREDLTTNDRWFSVHVTAKENHFTVCIDGRQVVDCIDTGSKRLKGYIALQTYTDRLNNHDRQTQVRFRNLMVKPLP